MLLFETYFYEFGNNNLNLLNYNYKSKWLIKIIYLTVNTIKGVAMHLKLD